MPPTDGPAPATPDEIPDAGPVSPGSGGASSCNSSPGDLSKPLRDASPFSATANPSPTSPTTPSQPPRRTPSLRTSSDPQTSISQMTPSSTVTGTLSNARRPPPSAGNLPLDLMQRARALQEQRRSKPPPHHQPGGMNGAPIANAARSNAPPPSVGGALAGGMAHNMRLPPHMSMGNMSRPAPPGFRSAPAIPTSSGAPGAGKSLRERRKPNLGPLPGGPVGGPAGRPQLKDINRDSRMDDFKHYIDAEKGWITFEGAATITRTGVNFAGGQTFKISLDEIQVLGELGKGNYGVVYKVRHAKPAVPRFGPGLSGFRLTHVAAAATSLKPSPHQQQQQQSQPQLQLESQAEAQAQQKPKRQQQEQQTTPQNNVQPSLQTLSMSQAEGAADGMVSNKPSAGSPKLSNDTSGKVMAMKEIRLELDEAKFATILKELVILHECVSPYIIEFYGAFFQEGAVYMCIEFMDGGSIDKLYAGGIPEAVLRKVAFSTVMGLKTLKDDHNIIHRDVKPTNILANTKGQVKICDFGVSGNLVASIARTNIGCQSYMAPERISGGGMSQGANAEGTYSVQSDIWSLGLTIIECAMGRYPYPPEVSSTIFGQLSAIVNGDPPNMPAGYSPMASDFVRSCLNKNPSKRFTYSMLLNHPWLKSLAEAESTIAEADEPPEGDEDGTAAVAKDMNGLRLDSGELGATAVAGDAEVAAWVTRVLEQKKNSSSEANGIGTKPALHAAPLAP